MKTRLLRIMGWLVLAAALAVGFLAYLQPGFMLDLANRFYMCF
ncbi:hypothetical protein [Massilia sp. NR 4-1]|nr:hypothetical protein [Massilia sp. NR 4-1]